MKLQQYLGGVEGLGPIRFERRVFVEPWEKRVFGIHAAMMGLSKHLSQVPYKYPIEKVPTKFKDQWTWAELRTLAEGMPPLDYIKYRYYEKWLAGLTHALVEMGILLRRSWTPELRSIITMQRSRYPRGTAKRSIIR